MSDAVTTTSEAPSNPTTSAPVTPAAAPAAQPQSRAGVISDAAYDALDPAAREKFARVRQGPQGGSEWRDRSTLPSETGADATQPGSAATPATVQDGKLVIGKMALDEADIQKLLTES